MMIFNKKNLLKMNLQSILMILFHYNEKKFKLKIKNKIFLNRNKVQFNHNQSKNSTFKCKRIIKYNNSMIKMKK